MDRYQSPARIFIDNFFRVVTGNGHTWETPLVTEEEGDVAFEWWSVSRVLVFFVSADEISYLWAWGPHIENEMEEGQDPTEEKLLELWKILYDVEEGG